MNTRKLVQNRSEPEILLSEQTVAPTALARHPVNSFSHEPTVDRMRFLWAHRSFLFRVTACGLVAATIIALLIPKRFISTARLMPPDEAPSSGLAMAAAALTGRSDGSVGSSMGSMVGEELGLKNTSDIFVGILGSDTAKDALIRQFDLRKIYGARQIEDARKSLESHTEISVDRKSEIITIAVTDRDPHRAADLASAYVQELNKLVSELSTSSARRERIFLEGRLQGVRRDLDAAEKSFGQFASKNTAIDVPAQGKAMVEAVAALQGQLIAAESELQGLKQIYSDNNVRVRSVNARVAELQEQLNRLGGKDDASITDSAQPGELTYPSIRKLPLLGVTYADLYREAKIQEAIFETLTQEYEVAKVQEAKEIPTVKVLDPPEIPEKKAYPPRTLVTLAGTVLALAGGILWLFGTSVWQATAATDPGKALAIEIFSTVKSGLPWTSRNGASHTGLENGAGREVDEAHQ